MRRSKNEAKSSPHSKCRTEPLEPRRLLAINATFVPATGLLSITGDSVANVIEVSRNAAGMILVNGGATPITGGTPTVANTSLVQIFGNAGADTITLNETNGALPTGQFQGGSENDTITGGSGNDAINGDDGNDVINAKAGTDNVFGGNGDDTLTGGDGNDTISGEIGNDRMIWNTGDDTDVNEGGDGNDTTEINAGAGAEVFTVAPNGTRVRFDRVSPSPISIDINATENLQLNCNGGDDSLSVASGLAPLIALAANGGIGNDTLGGGDGNETLSGDEDNDAIDGNGGNDVIFLGAGNNLCQWDPGDGSDTINGTAGADQLNFNGGGAADIMTIQANGSQVRLLRDVAGGTADVIGVETFQLNPLGGADSVAIKDLTGAGVTLVDLNLSGALGGAAGDAQADNVTLEGSGAGDNIQINAAAGSLNPTGLPVVVTVDQLDNVDAVTLSTLGSGDIITVNSTIGPLTILSGAGNDTINVLDSSALVTINTGTETTSVSAPFGDSLQVNSDFAVGGDTPAQVLIDQDDTMRDVTVSQSGILRITSGAVLGKSGGSLNITGTIDLAGGSLLHKTGGSTPDFRSMLIRGFNSGAWNGTSVFGAIQSSLAAGSASRDGVGYGLSSQIALTTIGSFTINSGDTLLRYTLDGDANLDAAVNAVDLGVLSANWQGGGKVFSQADFNYDAKVDLMDLYGLAVNFNQSVVPAVPVSLPQALPSSSPPRRSPTRAIDLINP